MRAPLSYHQERLWFIDRFETGLLYESSPVYHNIPLILRIAGPVDRGALEQSLNVLVNRHDALRTRIVGEKDQGFQETSRHDTIELSIERAPDSADTSLEQLIDLALQEARRPFVLRSDLPIRARLFQKSPVDALLVVTVHHIVADRRSTQILAEELADVYRARTSSAGLGGAATGDAVSGVRALAAGSFGRRVRTLSVLLEASAREEPEPAGAALESGAPGRPHVYRRPAHLHC